MATQGTLDRQLRDVRTFPQLVTYLRDSLDWPIDSDDFEDLVFDYEPSELGLDDATAAKVRSVKQLRPSAEGGIPPWGIFFVEFEPKRLPVVALRRILSAFALRRRPGPAQADRPSWQNDDMLFISAFGEGDHRHLTFAHFARRDEVGDLPVLHVLGWDAADTMLHVDHVHAVLRERLRWPVKASDIQLWREQWSSAFSLRHREVITTSRDLAIRMAQVAHSIRTNVNELLEIETDAGPMRSLKDAFKETLIHDLSDDDFADMYAQTITYGLLSARVTNPHVFKVENLTEVLPPTNPFLRDLLAAFLVVGGRKAQIDFDEVGINQVVDALKKANMEAVLRDFGDRNPEEDPVIHFYEVFLQQYDAQKRMQRGVFYTPRPVVSFIVRSVDELLRSEFGLQDGLADTGTWGEMADRFSELQIPDGVTPQMPFVQILDPATGTGTFLVEVIDVVYRTMMSKWEQEGLAPEAIRERWNQYVPAHLLSRLHGYELMMAPYAIAHLKIGLKLAETGYHFRATTRVRVFLANALEPPVAEFTAQIQSRVKALAHEALEVNDNKRSRRFTVVLGNPPYSRSSANISPYAENLVLPYKDLVREERNIQPLSDDYIKFIALGQRLVAQSRIGVFGMITNNTFLSGRIHRGMRQLLLEGNSHVRVVNLHGSQKVGFLGASGSGDQNVFDILQGVAITLMVRGLAGSGSREYSELVGSRSDKHTRLLAGSLGFASIAPVTPYYLLVPCASTGVEYRKWPCLTDIIRFQSVSGKPGDDDLLVSFDGGEVIPKLKRFSQDILSGDERMEELTEAGRNLARLCPMRFDQQRVIPYAYRPFDIRYSYHDPRIWTRPVERLAGCMDGFPVLLTTKIVKDGSFAHVFVTRLFPDVIFLSNTSSVNCYAFPRKPPHGDGGLQLGKATSTYHSKEVCPSAAGGIADEEALFYVYAILHSPGYRVRYLEPLRLDFPRIPVSGGAKLFAELAGRGRELVALHLMESEKLEEFITEYDGPRDPVVQRVGWSDGAVWLDAGAARKGQTAKRGTVGFRAVPAAVWAFRVGGYQVCEKWLKDRKGRTLSDDDIEHYQKIVVAISETIRLMKEIDEVIDEHGGWPGAFVTDKRGGA